MMLLAIEVIASQNQSRAYDSTKGRVVPLRHGPVLGAMVGQSGAPGKRNPSEFAIGELLGEGSYATVHRAVDKTNGQKFALKILNKAQIIRERKTQYVSVEKEALTRLHHSFFVKLFYTFQDHDSLYFVLELAENGDLLERINTLKGLPVNSARHYAAELALALEHLRACKIIHRDLKPENILLGRDWHIRVTDFGTAKILDYTAPTPPMPEGMRAAPRRASFLGTADYVSPEVLNSSGPATFSSDLWALGCIIYQMIAGKPPFRGSHDYETFQKVVAGEFDFPETFPPLAADLVSKLLVINPDNRLGAETAGGISALKAHPWFSSVEWESLPFIDPTLLQTQDSPPSAANSVTQHEAGLAVTENICSQFEDMNWTCPSADTRRDDAKL